MRRQPPRSTRTHTLSPYTTLFRSHSCRDPGGRFGKPVAKRHRHADGTPIATGPPPGVRAKTVETRQEIVGHANVAVPHIIELDVPDDRPEPLEAFTYVSAPAVAALHGYQHVPPRAETIDRKSVV